MSRFIAVCAFVLSLKAMAQPDSSPHHDLKAAQAFYAAGDFQTATHHVNELLLNESELKKPERAQLYLLKARLEVAYSRKLELRLWIGKALQADPTLTLDPVQDPPQLTEVWDEIHRETKAHAAKSKAETGTGDELAHDGSQGVNKVLHAFPFGVPQAQNGEPMKAVAFAVLQSALLTAGALTSETPERQGALAAFGALWLYSVYDGYSHEKTVKTTLQLVPNGTEPGIAFLLSYRY